MEYSINTAKNWHTIVSVTVTSDDVQAQYDKALKNVQKEAKVEGFRPGKVPVQLVKKWYGEKIASEANELSIQNAWKTVFSENDFEPLNEPEITNFSPTGGGFTFNIVFDIRPEIEVKGYEGMAVEKIIYDVTEEDVDAAINELRQRNAMLYTVEDEAKMGHFVFADFQEVDAGGLPVIGQKFENQQIFLGENDHELVPQLLGVKAGEERRVSLTVHKQESQIVEQPGPKEVLKLYQVTVKEIKERRVPDLDDEFAKDVGPFETMQQFREEIEKNLKHRAMHDSEHAFEHALADAIIARIEFELPETMIDGYLDELVRNVKERNEDNPNEIDEKKYREIYRDGAIWSLKWHLINNRLRIQESFLVTDDDINAKLEHYAEHGEDGIKRAEAIRNDNKALQQLKDDIIYDKIYDFLADKATVTEVHKPWRQSQEDFDADEDEVDAEVAAR